MPKSSYTPGPWKYEPHSPNRVIAPNNETVAAVYGGFVGDLEQTSNVRLITKAPLMFDYITKKANAGDTEAKDIIDGI